MATLYQIRDYYRMKQEAEAALTASPEPPDGQPRGTAGDPEGKVCAHG